MHKKARKEKVMIKFIKKDWYEKIFMIMLIFVLSIRVVVMVKGEEQFAETKACEVYSAGYELLVEDNNIVEFRNDGDTLMIAEYQDGKRNYKNGWSESIFVYENDIMKSEIRDGKTITYYNELDFETNSCKYTGYEIENELFYYIYDDEDRIIGISDVNGIQIAKYIYDGLYVKDVLQNVGEKWTSSTDMLFCGNYNKIRSNGVYYDDETDLYYSNGVYDDLLNRRIVGLVNNDEYLLEKNPFYEETTNEDDIMLLGYEDQDMEAEIWATELLSNSSFNAAKSSGYYSLSSTSTVEIVARLIYGENNKRTMDQRAISWVILNRYHGNGFGSSIRAIAANPAQFNGVNSSVGRRAQSSSDSYWRNAVYLACLMLTDSSESCWNVISPKPNGITNQLYFRSASSLGSTSQIFERGGVLYAHYSSGNVAISEACIAGEGTATTIAGLKALCTDSLSNYNVFFSH